MKYSEDTALSIQKKYGVSDTTLRIWKHRGRIPDKYAEKQVSMRTAFAKLHEDYQEKYLQSLSKNQRVALSRYLKNNILPVSASDKQVKQRLIDFRRWVRKNF